MAVASKLNDIGMIAISVAIGLLFYYHFSHLEKKQTKKHMEEMLAQLINFILFIWLGKIILNLSGFIADPLSVLAYPSDSKAFYFGMSAMALLLTYTSRKKKMDIVPFLNSLMYLFLASSFTYEFLQIVWKDNEFSFGYLILLAVLIGVFFYFRNRTSFIILMMIIMTLGSLGIISLALIQPFVTVFGYLMSPWVVGVVYIFSIVGLTYELRKEGKNNYD